MTNATAILEKEVDGNGAENDGHDAIRDKLETELMQKIAINYSAVNGAAKVICDETDHSDVADGLIFSFRELKESINDFSRWLTGKNIY